MRKRLLRVTAPLVIEALPAMTSACTTGNPRAIISSGSTNNEGVQSTPGIAAKINAVINKYHSGINGSEGKRPGADPCVGKGKVVLAMEFLERAIKADPSNRDAHYNLCQLLIRTDNPDFDAAATHYRVSIELGADPDVDLEAVLNL